MAHREPDTANRQRVEEFTQVVAGPGKWLQEGDPVVTQATRHWPVLGTSPPLGSVGRRASRPRTALPWGRREVMEKPSQVAHSGLTGMQQPWNYLELVLFWGETIF